MKAKAALFVRVGSPLEVREFPLVKPEPGSVLARIAMCTVCGSDVHTWLGHRPGKTPSILGHEMTGVVAELGEGVTHDYIGQPLAPGDRITWSMYSSCGACYYCRVARLPQKCTSLFKYGHEASDQPPYLNGGFAEYVFLRPGTGIIKVPDALTDEEVSPLNCATSTVASGLDAIKVEPGDTVVVQGLGMLGIVACAMAKHLGAGCVIAVDIDEARLAVARQFGADRVIHARDLTPDAMGEMVRGMSKGHGADLVIEVSGYPGAVPAGVAMCRRGGRYLLLGLVSPGAEVSIDWWNVVYKCLTVRGVHNYDFKHLVRALEFVAATRDRFNFKALVMQKHPLEDTEKAFQLCRDRSVIRTAVVPGL